MYFEIDSNNNIIGLIEIELEGVVSPELISRFVKASQEDAETYFKANPMYRHMFVWDGLRISKSQSLVLHEARETRKVKESVCSVIFNQRMVKVNVESVAVLQAYAQSSLEVVKYKCIDGWLDLSKADIPVLIDLMLVKLNSLFEDEHAYQA